MSRFFILIATLLLCACASGSAGGSEGRLQLVDLTDEFAQEWDRTASLEDQLRAEQIKTRFAALLPGFYSHERVGATPERYDAHFIKQMKRFPENRAGIEEVSRRFASMLDPARRSFQAEFGPMTGYPPIYLVNSLGEFDGGTRDLPEGNRLIFGADMMAELHLKHNVRPFFHHELFHLYHNRTLPECEPVWCNLWKEGLANYVAARLNPGATDAELLLTWPEPLRPAVERNRRTAVCATLRLLDSEETKVQRALLSNGKPEEGLPPRYGYYVGYLVAIEAGKTKSLKELARLGNDEVRPLVEASLRSLADCPST